MGQEPHPAWEHLTSVAAGPGVSSGVPASEDPQELLPMRGDRRPGRRIRARLHGPQGDQAVSKNRQREIPQAQWRHTSREGDVQGLRTPLPGAGRVTQPVLLSFLWPVASSILHQRWAATGTAMAPVPTRGSSWLSTAAYWPARNRTLYWDGGVDRDLKSPIYPTSMSQKDPKAQPIRASFGRR